VVATTTTSVAVTTTTLAVAEKCVAPAGGVPGLRFDGLYVTREAQGEHTIWQFLRFYPDGQVVLAAVQHDAPEAPVANVAKWLVADAKVGSTGCYTADGTHLTFETVERAGERVQVDYTGTIETDRLRLTWYSHKTQASSPEPDDYSFAPAP